MIHVHAPPCVKHKLERMPCPTCEKPKWFVCFLYEWYGWSVTCLACGEHWNDGERQERPFMRGWREKSKQSARDHYRRLVKR
ncbi:hypothetical protein LCGC14_3040370 [marine sediment metagenome]|uniref:Uncharacterized protein n=1 Tax=marine sediment metagenome TaxID=412755 RepID=A0A0F8XD09_9ZZZZ